MKCKDVMTKHPKCINASSHAREAAQIMQEEDVGIVPVIDDKTQKLIGVVTDRDLCLKVVAEGKNPHEVNVLACMTEGAISCFPEEDVHKAEELMKEHQIRRITVVDQNGYCTGIISQGDIAMKAGKAEEIYETLKAISRPKKLMAA